MTEEEFDVLDVAGQKTGKVLPKSVVHERELWHGSVFIWIYNSKGEVLLQYRSADKSIFPSVWDVSVAGHISAGETLGQAAVREIEEEIGEKVTADQLQPIGEYPDTVYFERVHYPEGKPHYEYCWVFLLKLDRGLGQLTPRLEELTELKWLPIAQLKSDLTDPKRVLQYSARDKYVYDVGFAEIEKATM
jgi:isopentenyl-diphosphate Delta-isomerase